MSNSILVTAISKKNLIDIMNLDQISYIYILVSFKKDIGKVKIIKLIDLEKIINTITSTYIAKLYLEAQKLMTVFK